MFKVSQDSQSGKKVLALQAIEPGSVICRFSGKLIDYKDTIELGSKESFAFQVGKNRYHYLDEPYRYFNHSCEPNCGVTPEMDLVAIKLIKKGEELRYDYSTTMMEHHWTMRCNCKAKKCRKTVKDFYTLPKELQLKYIRLDIVQDFIKEWYVQSYNITN